MASAVTEDADKHRFNGDLYRALMRQDKEKVIELCRNVPERALHVLTRHNDTVLHMAAYSRQEHLLLRLVEEELPVDYPNKMTSHQNDNGNTILHEAAATVQDPSVAEKMLQTAPALLGIRNHLGETAIFPAAHYGNTVMFRFLADKVSEYSEADRQAFLQRDDQTTVLHISILAENFELALEIAERYEHLISKPDKDGMTGLQLLSCNSSFFTRKPGSEDAFLKRLINSVKSYWQKPDQSPALQLAKFLIKRDTSWEATNPGIYLSKPTPHNYSVNPKASSLENRSREGPSTVSLSRGKGKREVPLGCSSNAHEASFRNKGEEGLSTGSLSQGNRGGESPQIINGSSSTVKIGESPLFLATKSDCVEIVEEILHQYPQAVEYINADGENILHLAIKYRQLKIFELVKKMEVPMRRLVQHVDSCGNSILHMVGARREDNEFEKTQGPALKLQEELLWLERVKKVSITHFISHRNLMGQTANGLFASTNRELHTSAKQWLKRTSEGCSIVAVLIASVTFAAAYAIPGGPNQNTGFPLLLSQPFFVIFIVSDVSSFAFALIMMIIFLSILSSSLRIEDFKMSLPLKLMLGFNTFFFSVSMMTIAFAATILLMIQNKKSWTQVILYGIPVSIFSLSYFPLYMLLSKTDKYLLKKAKQVFPWSHCVKILTKITNLFKSRNTQIRNPSNPPQSRGSDPTNSISLASPQTSNSPV